MSVIDLAVQAAQLKQWPAVRDASGELRLEIPLPGGRSQLVQVTPGSDGDGDPAAYVWSKAADVAGAALDPWQLLRLNTQLTYGRVALRGDELIVVHALGDADAQLPEVGKTLYWVARAADDIEQGAYGAYLDRL